MVMKEWNTTAAGESSSKADEGESINFTIQGMNCAACAARIEKAISRMGGVHEAAVSFPLRTAWVQYDSDLLAQEQISSRVEQLGFSALLHESASAGLSRERKSLRLRLMAAIMLTMPLLASMVEHLPPLEPLLALLPAWLLQPWLQLILATIVQFVIGMPFYFGAYYAVRQRSANMDVLVVLGTTAAYFYSHYEVFRNGLVRYADSVMNGPPLYFETSAVVITAVLLGKYIETSASLRSQDEAVGYSSLQNQTANVERAGEVMKLRSEFVRKGDIVIVQPGEIIPIDGKVVDGASMVNEALLTGESKPAMKQAGDVVWAGTSNDDGQLRLRTTAAGHDTMLSRIQEMVKHAQRSKSSIQTNVDKVASRFVPMMLVFALLTLLAWGTVLDPGNWSKAVICAIAVLLAACPCALGLAAPISLVIASGRLAKQGIIAKEAGAIERLAAIQMMILDKTGTLTEGRPRVSYIHAVQGNRSSLLRLAAAAEAESTHPLALAIKDEANRLGLVIPAAEQVSYTVGGGVEAELKQTSFAIGNARFVEQRGWVIGAEARRQAADREKLGETVLYVIVDQACAGIISLSDTLKQQAGTMVKALQRFGITAVVATGDHHAPANTVAKAVGIKSVYASMLPESKQALVEEFKRKGKRIAMAGDGWNDAPALAAADVGIAMGNGTNAALDAGHITLLFSRLMAIPEAIRLSRFTIRNIKQNLTFAFLYNVIIIPFAAIGLLEPWMAGTAMALSSVSVVGNALRLKGQLMRSGGAGKR